MNIQECRRGAEQEITELEYGMDFREPKYRREVFLRFYEFHTKYKAHPGAVYYAFPWLFDKFNMDMEQRLWFCFINGVSQNVVTTFKLWQNSPDLNNLDIQKLSTYFRENYLKFGWDIDRRYVKNSFEKAILKYKELIDKAGSQQEYFNNVFGNATTNEERFTKLWDVIMKDFYLFGRLSTFSYMEYLRIAGLPINCNNLFLYDIDGSKSHRNGLCKILGRDDLDWHDKYNPEFTGYTTKHIDWLTEEAYLLLQEAKQRGIDAHYFTLESTMCCYKSWYRPNRRYPNVYNDMFYERILRDEKLWGQENILFRQLRKECLPDELLLEQNPWDPGLKPLKQNWFRETGQPIMMDAEWECFKNGFKQAAIKQQINIKNGVLF